ncbi:hypothetical protein M9H77_30575 [Catharanthus roseus]|uniref:Uncharacterized protein n=1 Tax=Catharanthus roseus TaxID=4058 RepID=A0ACB9ZZW6_CATRO|nr:hypothetical protein M9H77_30575 [Catharanthus roseus]
MEIIPTLFHDIGWGSLLIVNEPFYPMMLYEFYANLLRGRNQFGENVITSRVNGKNIVVDDRLLNSILETPADGMCFYTKNKKSFDQNLYSEKRFEEIFAKGIVLKRRHKSSITNMHSSVMLVMHEHKKLNFGYIAIEHMLAIQSSSTKYLPYGCFITKIFQHFEINLVGVGDHIGPGKICNQNTFKRMGFERTDEGLFIRGGQQGSDDDDDEEDNGDEEKGNEPESMVD